MLISFNISKAQRYKINKIVIDAGHGGHDPGCLGSKTKEKDVALSIALKLGKNIEKNIPDVEVIFTRSTDVFVELFKRAQIANENKADLFISIHCNANPSKSPSGTETYVMGLHKSQANLEVAQKENASILMEDSYSNNYDGFDPASTEAYIIFSLYQNAYLDHSLNLATKVEKHIKEKVGISDRGVKQAGFLVLYKTAMPSILVEAGFLSNAKDEEFLCTAKGQECMASAIFSAFKAYKNEVEKNVPTSDNDNNILKNEDTITYSKIVKDPLVSSKQTVNKNDTINNKVVFTVQFATSSVKKDLNFPGFKGLNNVREYFHKGIYKYVTGNETSAKRAISLLEKVRDIGFKDAFIVAFLNNERISPQEVVKLLKKN